MEKEVQEEGKRELSGKKAGYGAGATNYGLTKTKKLIREKHNENSRKNSAGGNH